MPDPERFSFSPEEPKIGNPCDGQGLVLVRDSNGRLTRHCALLQTHDFSGWPIDCDPTETGCPVLRGLKNPDYQKAIKGMKYYGDVIETSSPNWETSKTECLK